MTAEQFNLELQGFKTAIALAIVEEKKASERVAELQYREALYIQQAMGAISSTQSPQPGSPQPPQQV